VPLEDLTADGYTVSRPDEELTPGMPTLVDGHGRQFYVSAGEDEEAAVARARNHAALAGKMEQAQAYFADNYRDWGTMTAQQKDQAGRQAQRALANLIRHVRDDLGSGGV
jgi:hypothetical protein